MAAQPLVMCIYTHGSPYELEAQELGATARQFGYPFQAVAVPDQGNWWKNVGIKPQIVLDLMKQHDGPLLALDADCRILRPLDEMLALLDRADVAVKCRPDSCFSALFNAAVLLLRRTPATLALVETWAQRGQQYAYLHRFAEQGAFSEAVMLVQNVIRLVPLEERFHAFAPFDDPETAPPDCVIFHRKSSRVTRKAALPTESPLPARTTDEGVEFITIKPRTNEAASNLPTNGIEGADADCKEYLSRHGIGRVWTLAAGVPRANEFEQAKFAVIRDLMGRFPIGTRLIVSDYDTLFLGDPRVFATGLDVSDAVFAWDSHLPHSLPSLRVIAAKVGPAWTEFLIPHAEQAFAQMRSQLGPAAQLSAAVGKVLATSGNPLSLATLPAATIADLVHAGPTTTVVSVRGRLKSLQGDASCFPSPMFPRAHLGTSQVLA